MRGLLFLGNGAAIGPRAFRADVDDIRPVGQLLAGAGERGIDVGYSIAAEGIGDEIDDAHDQRAHRELDRHVAQDQLHGSGTKEIRRCANRPVCV